MRSLILVGGGGHCKSCIDVIRMSGEYEIKGILDTADKVGSEVSGIKIIGTDESIFELAESGNNFLITIGQIRSATLRIKIFQKIKESGGKLPVIVSPRSYVSITASLSEGTIVMHDAVINAEAKIGRACIINTGALIEHEAEIGDYCHISTNSVVNGQVHVGSMVFIGSNSVIANNLLIPEETIVAAGASVLKNPVEKGIYIGNPARKSL